MAQELEKIDPETGEVMTISETAAPLAVQLAQAELNQAVTTARAFPRRSPSAIATAIMGLATIDEETAEESVYALPRGGKPIKGPSIRFAEIVASQWGNCHTGSRVVAVDKFDKVVIAEGVFHDLETGMKRTAQIRRKISGRDGRIFNDDMITVTGNAAASIAMREAILKGIPKAVWRKAYEHCEKVIAGDISTLNESRDKVIKAFAAWGIKPEQIFASLDIEDIDGIGLDQVATLRAMYKAIKEGNQKVEDYFPAKADGDAAVEAARGTAAKLNNIANQGKADDGGKKAEHSAKGGDKPAAKGKAADPKPKAAEDKPKADKAADEPPADDQGEPAGASGQEKGDAADAPAAEDGASNEDRTFTDDELEAAYQRGAEAKKKGMPRKAAPPEWREPGFEPLMDAWVAGHTETEA